MHENLKPILARFEPTFLCSIGEDDGHYTTLMLHQYHRFVKNSLKASPGVLGLQSLQYYSIPQFTIIFPIDKYDCVCNP
jgi:hypothetical protein